MYLVQEINWAYDDEWYDENGTIPKKAYADRKAAENARTELENAARKKIASHDSRDNYDWWSNNLDMTFGGLENITSLDGRTLNSRLTELGLPRYAVEESDDWRDDIYWLRFWKAVRSTDTDEAVWQLLDKIRFYEVAEVEADV